MPESPERIGSFDIIRRLGAGGMAEVFLAKKIGAEGTFKLLVLKRILPRHSASRRFRTMFVEEAHLATRLNHPNIVQVYEFSDYGDEGLLLSMEFVEGFDLGKLISASKQKNTPVLPWVAAFIISEAAKGLHYAHERRDEGGAPLAIVHRDVSPQNVIISAEGVVKIADFGIASANLFREEPGVLKGKFGYMSPEQARGEKVDRRSDIYALGVVLYEVLTRRSPYANAEGEKPVDDALLEAVRDNKITPIAKLDLDIPSELQSIVERAMAPSRDNRYQNARDMSGAISRALLAKQELVDAASVEAVLASLLDRSALMPSVTPPDAGQQTQAAAPQARTNSGSEASLMPPRRPREVRHVAVVRVRLDGIEGLERHLGKAGVRRAIESLKGTLEHIAYKRETTFQWETRGDLLVGATAILGLMSNPTRAPFEAASLAIDVHEAIAGAADDLPIAAAIGIIRGIAVGQRDELGHLSNHHLEEPAPYLADRVGREAPKNDTWVAGGLYRLVRRDFRWGDAPFIEFPDAGDRDVPRRMRVYSLTRPLTREERAAEMALAPNDLVGRDAEKADLHAAFHRAISSASPAIREESHSSSPPARGQITARAIVGELGIGKTALVATFLGELPRDVRVLSIECSPNKSEIPLATLCDLLREATGVGIHHSLDEASAVFRGLLGQAVARSSLSERLITRLSEVATGKQSEDAEEDGGNYRRDLLFVAVRFLLGALGLEQPLIVTIDGLQWADRPSLELIQELLKRDERLAIMVVLVTRSEDRVATFIEGLVRIELGGLSAEEQVRLVEARLGVREGVAAICGELLPRVGGNPFFLLEMIDALLERGTIEIVERPDGGHELRRNDSVIGDKAEGLPSTLEQLIGDRIRELPSAEHDVVDWLAVAGGPLLENDIVQLTRAPDGEAVTRLCARGLCDRKGGVVDFRHPLVRDVTYMALDPPDRVRMHRLLGEHLSTTPLAHGLAAAIVARHLARGEAPIRAAELYLEAASAARNANQAQLAQRYYLRALSLLPQSDPRRMVAHDSLEAIYRYLGRRRERRHHLVAMRKLARESGRAKWAALALMRTARLELDEGVLARGLPVAQRAAELARLAKTPSLEVEALTVLSEILRDLGDTQGAINACEQALAVSGGLQPRARAEVLRAKGILLRYVGRVEEAVVAYAEAIAVFRAVGARRSEARAMTALAFAMFVSERFEDVIVLGLESIRIDLSIGGRFQIAKTLSNVGQGYARLGDLDRGLNFLRRAREAHERYADQDSRADTLICTAGILIEAGDVDAAHTLVGDAGALVAVTGSVYDSVHERIIRALLARAQGDAQSAIHYAAEARQVSEAQAFMSFHVYATAVEAAARVDAGEHHTGALLARTALGAIENTRGSEYGVEVRALCCDALKRAAPQAADDAFRRAASHVRSIAENIRDLGLRRSFLLRPTVLAILADADVSLESLGVDAAPVSRRASSNSPNAPKEESTP